MSISTLQVPKMYADHHTLRVREALTSIPGVVNVVASSGRKMVTVEYGDPASAEQIQQALVEAGYAPGEERVLSQVSKHTDDGSNWYGLLQRVTVTN